MALRLRPARRRRRANPSLSIPVIALPMLGLLVLVQAASLRGPLSEAEAPLAIAVRYPNRDLVENRSAATSAAAAAVARLGSQVVGTTEFRLRLAGVAAGCSALGLLVWLGARLATTRAGVVAALTMIATPAGRSLLGADFGVEPFYLVLMIMALGAIRNLAMSRRSLVHAGVAGGAAIALIGPSATWIPLLAIAWLRWLRGLSWRSFAIAAGAAAGSAVAVSLLAALFLGIAPLPAFLALPDAAESTRAFVSSSVQLAPFVPLLLLGIWNAPKRWRRQRSSRFLLRWILLALGALLLFGTFAPLWTALAMAVGMTANWALSRAERGHATLAIVIAIGASVWLGSLEPAPGGFDADRWAVRETAKFVQRHLEESSTVGAPNSAHRRLAYYATRAIRTLDDAATDFAGLDYVVLDTREFDAGGSKEPGGSPPPRVIELHGRRLRVVAEFGSWMLARVEPA